jgi:site-specific DNA-methyltransferase (adenine-specific)
MIGMKDYPDKYFDLAIVDPPYGLDDWNERGSNKRLYENKKFMDLEKIREWEDGFPYEKYFEELFRVSENQIIWGGNHFLDFLGKTKQMIIWDKAIRGMHFNDCEIAWCSNIKEACRIFTHTANQLDRIHPTQKPIALYKWLLTKYAKPGDKILDTHVGSASSLIACEDLGFEYVGFELDKDYYNAAQKRLEQFRAQLKLAI